MSNNETKVSQLNYILSYIIENSKHVGFFGNVKLQKLLYFAQAKYMIDNEGKVMFNEDFEAWNMGPVVPIAYQNYKYWGLPDYTKSCEALKDETEIISAINFVIEKYANMSSTDLIELTHIKDGPWDKTYNNNTSNCFSELPYSNNIIPKGLILSFYKNKGL